MHRQAAACKHSRCQEYNSQLQLSQHVREPVAGTHHSQKNTSKLFASGQSLLQSSMGLPTHQNVKPAHWTSVPTLADCFRCAAKLAETLLSCAGAAAGADPARPGGGTAAVAAPGPILAVKPGGTSSAPAAGPPANPGGTSSSMPTAAACCLCRGCRWLQLQVCCYCSSAAAVDTGPPRTCSVAERVQPTW
jgi:hypothetical protein